MQKRQYFFSLNNFFYIINDLPFLDMFRLFTIAGCAMVGNAEAESVQLPKHDKNRVSIGSLDELIRMSDGWVPRDEFDFEAAFIILMRAMDQHV